MDIFSKKNFFAYHSSNCMVSMGEVTILDFASGANAKSNNDFDFGTKPKFTFMTLAL